MNVCCRFAAWSPLRRRKSFLVPGARFALSASFCFRAYFIARTMLSALLLLHGTPAVAAVWYVAPGGSDSDVGNQASPFATITKAQSAAASGDTVYLRGGTYYLNNSSITATNNPWIIVNNITKSGIGYLAFPGELPVFDFASVQPSGYRVTAFLVTGNNCVFQGFDVVGVQV